MDISVLSTGHYYALALLLCMAWVVVSDAVHYIIPNTLNAFIIVLYVAAAILLPIHGWLPAFGAAAVVLAVGLGMFTLGLMGGGDIKLLVALSLWTGWSMATVQFLFMTTIFGGVLVIVVLLARFMGAPLWLKARPNQPLPRLLTKKQPVPYGIAIAAAFAWLLWTGQVVGVSV